MTRPSKPQAAEKEARMQEALAAVRSGKHNANSAASAFKVFRQTLYDRLNGKLPRNQAHEGEQILSHAEEKELVRWITRLTSTGYPPRHSTLVEMAEEIRKQRVRQINDDSIQLTNYEPIGKQWVPRFLRRHTELASIITRKIDAPRVKDTSQEALRKWFDELKRVVDEFGIKPKNIYNMDESGFAIGEIEATKRIINANIRQQFQAKPGRQEWVTSVECICADGTSISPLIIFRGKSIQPQYLPPNCPNNWLFYCNTKGWTSNEHGIEWLRRCFEPQTREKADGEIRLLICDGHDSHITGAFIGHCMDNNIHLMILPPHSSHLTQPLDVGVFGALKKIMAAKIDPLIRTGVANIQKWEWLEAFIKAHRQVFRPQNILGGFRGTGIVPYEPQKVIDRVSSQTTPELQPCPITPPATTPFTNAVLTSSPIDMDAVRFANSALNDIVENNSSLPTPARKYIKSLTRTNERLYASKTIVQLERDDLYTAFTARKTRPSGRRRVTSGQHLVTTAEVLTGVIAAEEETRKRKARGPQKPRKRGSNVSRVSSDESGDDLDRGTGVEIEVIDSIDS